MAEIGGEIPKPSLKERIGAAFNKDLAKKEWYKKHAEIVKQYTDVNNGLSEDQRAQAMAQLEDKATKDASWAVGGHWVALAGVTATAVLGTIGIVKPELVDTLAGKMKNLNIKGHNFGLGKVGEGLSTAANVSHDFLTSIPLRAVILKNQLVERGKGVFASFKKAPAPPAV